MRLTLERRAYMPAGVLGILRFGARHIATLELPWEDNHPEESCIPVGVYVLTWWESPTHGWVLRVHDVPGRTDIEIHPANKVTELLGCIGVGMSEHMSFGEPYVQESHRAMQVLIDWLPRGEQHSVEIVNYQGGEL